MTIGEAIDRAMASIRQRGTSDEVLLDELQRVARIAFQLGSTAALDTLLSARDVAEALGVSHDSGYVARMARKHNIGAVIAGTRLFRPEDLDELRAIKDAAVPGRRKSHYRIIDGPARPRDDQ